MKGSKLAIDYHAECSRVLRLIEDELGLPDGGSPEDALDAVKEMKQKLDKSEAAPQDVYE